jgi:pimeloyl-ACP methyl ester carboxylesterase
MLTPKMTCARLLSALAFASSLCLGCSCEDEPTLLRNSDPASKPLGPTASRPMIFRAADGVPLHGELYLAHDQSAPIVVFVHHYRGDRVEWKPMAERLARAQKRYTLVNFDLRGHGASKQAADGKVIDWYGFERKDVPRLVMDLHAAADQALSATGGRARGIVVVGSSLGGSLGAQLAREQEKVMALALVSPADFLEGYDVVRRFGAVRDLPSFIAAAQSDTISYEIATVLNRIGGAASALELYEGTAHGADTIGGARPKLWTDLEQWLMSVFDKTAPKRETLARGNFAVDEPPPFAKVRPAAEAAPRAR